MVQQECRAQRTVAAVAWDGGLEGKLMGRRQAAGPRERCSVPKEGMCPAAQEG